MTTMLAPARRTFAGWPEAMALAVLCLLASGCATRPEGAGGGGPDIVAAQEDSEPRRRARIRLELASSYFEQGKTDIALDELRQVVAIDPTLPDAYVLRGLI